MIKNSQGGFTLIESIIIIALMMGLGFVVYHFGWGTSDKAGAKALETDIKTMEVALFAYVTNSNGLYPTADSELPKKGEYKLIIWETRFTSNARQLSFYPDFIKKLPKHWNEGVWRIDSVGRISVTSNPEDY